MTGNPVRRDLVQRLPIRPRRTAAAPTRRASTSWSAAARSARSRSTSWRAEALIELAKDHPLAITHQTGDKDLEVTAARYAEAGVDADCRAFIKDMATTYLAADLVIGRAGATTVAELAIAGKPALFIPYPFAADNHQEINAQEMADAGRRARCSARPTSPPTSSPTRCARCSTDPAPPRRDGRRDEGAREARRRRRRDRLGHPARMTSACEGPTPAAQLAYSRSRSTRN